MNPWTILLALLLVAGAAGGAYLQGRADGRDAAEAQTARDERIGNLAAASAASAAAGEIARITMRQTIIKQEVQHAIEVQPVYRDCGHSAEQLQRINAAITDAGAGGAAGGGELPAAHPAGK